MNNFNWHGYAVLLLMLNYLLASVIILKSALKLSCSLMNLSDFFNVQVVC